MSSDASPLAARTSHSIGLGTTRLVFRLITMRASPGEVRISGEIRPLLTALLVLCFLAALFSSLCIGEMDRALWRLLGCAALGLTLAFSDHGRRVAMPGALLISAGIDFLAGSVALILHVANLWAPIGPIILTSLIGLEFAALVVFLFKAHSNNAN